jgi:hypothetical protein
VLAFLDTEFTALVFRPRLLSVGIVTGSDDGPEFYAEVTDPDRIQAAGWYAVGAVLPQFGKVDHAACSFAELGLRLSSFFLELVARLGADESVEVAYGHDLDWELVELAISDACAGHWEATRRRLRPVNLHAVTGFGPGRLAADAYFKGQALAPFARHHALCDARALRVAHEASVRVALAA